MSYVIRCRDNTPISGSRQQLFVADGERFARFDIESDEADYIGFHAVRIAGDNWAVVGVECDFDFGCWFHFIYSVSLVDVVIIRTLFDLGNNYFTVA